ncbi:PDZ domain-containing protein [Methanoplanus sp. FWC-SCC4]|uniref:PDZ domain-containing protein n=1 Tax=Methanochimaera problematica TaxID=2609417 RepID=A0AA97FBG6_9EURY|nr:site-2 protease family protein [Methanoplanus sp. FWC-SCC4]WOF15822.1 PDZ domain-containing protein [Methanoplanus sp. FWC-SCC4]
MNWLLVVLFLVALYFLVVGYIKANNLWEDHVMFYGPILALKTDNVKFFDKFIPYSRFWKLYGTLGALMVVVVSVLMTAMLLFTLQKSITSPPPPTGIYEPQNILAIPGVNEFLPLSLAVLIAFIVTLAVHEGGHGILSRIEGIRVRSTGILFFVIPIGAFVEPDEEDIEKSGSASKIRMFGAGITNNIVVALISFILLAGLIGFATPTDTPYIKGVYQDYPAFNAHIPQNSIITQVNDQNVFSRNDVSEILSDKKPGDTITLAISHDGTKKDYTLTLDEWPKEFGEHSSGFMGVYYYDSATVKNLFDKVIKGPLGPLLLIYVPINSVIEGDNLGLGLLAFDSPETAAWEVPFTGFWGVIQILFWMFWFNFAVATFNALPFVPLDGGYIMQEGIRKFFEKRELSKEYANYVVSVISIVMIVVLASIILVPYIAAI